VLTPQQATVLLPLIPQVCDPPALIAVKVHQAHHLGLQGQLVRD